MQNTLDNLIKNNPSTTLIFQSRMLQELKNEFTKDEQEIFVANFYMYLNYHQTDEYPISLDDIWKWIGYSTKASAKRVLMNENHNFIKGKDYKILVGENLCTPGGKIIE